MAAYLILVLAALSRLLPHAFHSVGLNVTAVGAGLLFFGARRPRIEAVVGAIVMAATDLYLTTAVYHFPFHVRSYIVTWCWYAAAALVGSTLLRKVTAVRVIAAVFASATGFFLVSNFTVWLGHMYAHSAAGLVACYWQALPFYRNDLLSTGAFSAVFFGLPALATRMSPAAQRDKNASATA